MEGAAGDRRPERRAYASGARQWAADSADRGRGVSVAGGCAGRPTPRRPAPRGLKRGSSRCAASPHLGAVVRRLSARRFINGMSSFLKDAEKIDIGRKKRAGTAPDGLGFFDLLAARAR